MLEPFSSLASVPDLASARAGEWKGRSGAVKTRRHLRAERRGPRSAISGDLPATREELQKRLAGIGGPLELHCQEADEVISTGTATVKLGKQALLEPKVAFTRYLDLSLPSWSSSLFPPTTLTVTVPLPLPLGPTVTPLPG